MKRTLILASCLGTIAMGNSYGATDNFEGATNDVAQGFKMMKDGVVQLKSIQITSEQQYSFLINTAKQEKNIAEEIVQNKMQEMRAIFELNTQPVIALLNLHKTIHELASPSQPLLRV